LRLAVPQARPRVSALIPARDEASVVESTVRAWLSQDYAPLEIFLLDDGSADGTGDLARRAAGSDPRLTVLPGAPLPPGWTGKNWACHQLAQAASGEVFVFTDADVRWTPTALTALLAELERGRADLLTVWPTQSTVGWSERLVVSQMALVVIGYLPLLAVHWLPWPVFSAANGQCLAFRREAYEALGGHAAVRSAIVEDMAFAWAVKRARLRLRMADGAGLVSTRMYRGWSEVRDGFAKNILYGHAGSVLLLLFSALFHWGLFLVPWIWLSAAAFAGAGVLRPVILVGLGLGVRALTAAVTRQRPLDALLMPLSVLLMTEITARSLVWHFRGGPRWRGRVYAR
jgi:chlorobactene glucosyltransferase